MTAVSALGCMDHAEPWRELMLRALRVADEACLELVRGEGVATRICGGSTWYDIGSLFDPMDYDPASIANHAERIAHGIDRRLLQHRAKAQCFLVRINPRRISR